MKVKITTFLYCPNKIKRLLVVKHKTSEIHRFSPEISSSSFFKELEREKKTFPHGRSSRGEKKKVSDPGCVFVGAGL